MLSKRWINGLDAGRLRRILLLFFIALTVPMVALIWQAYGQLKWESFHQHRISADGLSRRIDTRLIDLIRVEDARSFADYSFVVVAGNTRSNFVQRSPLSEFPVRTEIPGVLGYFQVDSEGTFTTPLLPPTGTEAESLGIDPTELANRNQAALQLQTVLAENRLVELRPTSTGVVAGEIAASRERATEEAPVSVAPSTASAPYSQQVFDRLNSRSANEEVDSSDVLAESADSGSRQTNARGFGKLSDLELDKTLDDEGQSAERRSSERETFADSAPSSLTRSKRVEQTLLPEPVAVDSDSAPAPLGALRINTFESEIDPFEFSLLDGGHIVLFRKVWRDNERFIQGLLLDQQEFLDDILGDAFAGSVLFGMSNLIVAHNDDVIDTFSGITNAGAATTERTLGGTLLYRQRLSAPWSTLELIFSVTRLPPGPGASVLAWITVVLTVVFVTGFLMMYRLGVGQITLARQQQDFVSAVSHELKTPLTSIRMYGEMLKEGWADESKRKTYYQFIHDESERLSKLIENVLQLSRMSRDEPHLNLQSAKVGSLMSNLQSKISSQVERAGFELRIDREEIADQSIVLIDEDAFAQIVINLVDNAIKFSRDSQTQVIELSGRRIGEGDVQVAVRDFGPGVAKDQMKKIFERFYRSESELTRETVGTGIGLAIVHQLTQAMGGTVDLVNVDPGAEFRVRIPLESAGER